MAVSLAEAKAWLRISYDDEDTTLQSLIEAATAYVNEIGVATAAPVPAPIRHAILMLVSHWNENRDAVMAGGVRLPLGFDALIQPYRKQML